MLSRVLLWDVHRNFDADALPHSPRTIVEFELHGTNGMGGRWTQSLTLFIVAAIDANNLAYRKPVAQGLFEIIELFQPQFFTTRQSQHFTTQSIIRHFFAVVCVSAKSRSRLPA